MEPDHMHAWDFSGFHYEACNEADKLDFEKAIETVAVAFSSKWVSEAPWLHVLTPAALSWLLLMLGAWLLQQTVVSLET